MIVRFSRSARKHRVGKGRALEVMANAEPTQGVRADGTAERTWYGPDDRGVMMSVVGIIVPERTSGEEMLLVLHVMPEYS